MPAARAAARCRDGPYGAGDVGHDLADEFEISSARRSSPTVVVTKVQPRIGPIRCHAALSPSLTLVSSPRKERTAQAASATLKKMAMNVDTYAVAMPAATS